MRANIKLTPLALIITFSFLSCTITREPIRHRDVYFRPLTSIPQRTSTTTISQIEINQLKEQLEQATKIAMILHDSLSSLQSFTGTMLETTRELIAKISELEANEYLSKSKQKELEQSIAQLRYENQQLAQQLNEIRARVITGMQTQEKSVYTPAKLLSTLQDEYNEGLSLFHRKRYNEAQDIFDSLIDKGIEEDLSDNCVYWIGECQFAKKDYKNAIKSFQKVLEIKSSNKKIDAYYMLGRCYEAIGDLVKARWAYEELNLLYPENIHSKRINAKLREIKKYIPNNTPSKTNTDSNI